MLNIRRMCGYNWVGLNLIHNQYKHIRSCDKVYSPSFKFPFSYVKYSFQKYCTSALNYGILMAGKMASCYYTTGVEYTNGLSSLHYETVAEETLQSITERFEDIIEDLDNLGDVDVNYSNGVITVNLGKIGTYVINKQTPNRQIWLSSPLSGPKRYDFVQGAWIYKHEGISLHELLNKEVSAIINKDANFT